jgi:hypothetical protein
LTVAPDDLIDRIRRLLVAPSSSAIEELCALAAETFDLVEHWLPNADVTSARAAFEYRRTS